MLSRPVAMSSTFFRNFGNPVRKDGILFLCSGTDGSLGGIRQDQERFHRLDQGVR